MSKSKNIDTNWLNMMFPRLYLARNLLREDGVIFISIDDNEVTNLKHLCNEVFGEENFIDCMIWKKRYGGGAKEKYFVTMHEYVLVYARNLSSLAELFVPLSQEAIERYYKLKDENYEQRGGYRLHPLESMKSFGERKNLVFTIEAPDGTLVSPKRQWRWSQKRVEEAKSKGELAFVKLKSGEWSIQTKLYLKDDSEDNEERQTKMFSIIDEIYSQHGTTEIHNILGNAQIFNFPKPSKFIKKLLQVTTKNNANDLILDFFSGSATTAHAVLEMNKEDGGNRRFIMVQIPEPCDENSEAFKADYKTIADIGKERIRRVIKKVKDEKAEKDNTLLDGEEKPQDLGFRVFKLDRSNFRVWDGSPGTTAESCSSVWQR